MANDLVNKTEKDFESIKHVDEYEQLSEDLPTPSKSAKQIILGLFIYKE